MTEMHEHDAPAYARASAEHGPRVDATDGRTDGLTQKNSPNAESSSYVSRAGGLQTFVTPPRFKHDKTPHVYVVYWPKHAVIKVGMSNVVRWRAWRSRGAVEIATIPTCCMAHARTIETWALRSLRADLKPAFTSKDASTTLLNLSGVGWSECYQLHPDYASWGLPVQHDWDYGRAYGLDMGVGIISALIKFDQVTWAKVYPVSPPDCEYNECKCPARHVPLSSSVGAS